MATSTLLTVVVLGLTLMCVVSFAFLYQNIRHIYLLRMSSMIARTEEAISVSGWKSSRAVVIELKNNGGVGVYIREARTILQAITTYAQPQVKIFTSRDIHLPPLKKVYLSYEVPPHTLATEVNFVSVIVTTDKNVYIFDVVPPIGDTVLFVTRDEVEKGVTYSVNLPNGKIALLRPYEIMFCAVSSGERNGLVVPSLDSVSIAVAGGGMTMRGIYHYGYNTSSQRWSKVSILFDRFKPESSDKIITSCSIRGSDGTMIPPRSRVVLAKGILLVGTQITGYDISHALFAGGQHPVFYRPRDIGLPDSITMVNVTTSFLTMKIGLPAYQSEIDIFDFVSAYILPPVAYQMNGTTVYTLGSYYAQAILVIQAIQGVVDQTTASIDVYGYFPDPYPLIVVISSIEEIPKI